MYIRQPAFSTKPHGEIPNREIYAKLRTDSGTRGMDLFCFVKWDLAWLIHFASCWFLSLFFVFCWVSFWGGLGSGDCRWYYCYYCMYPCMGILGW
ncbi:hypothetical protein BDV41DRAFT_75712 [Aspergillus transmontanensis]|uniref:Uncharacterized protein n=1 Tax=Aspergillus transmontanensis TaxID=1034304 RepID=A0A5N6W8B6_9EURO|nr:hypothetical protein BDV41DRAFT_75712 [Aspergillus transmontanensis]